MEAEEFEKVRYEVDGHVATITLDDPETRNSLSNELLDELLCSLSMARTDDEVRVVVLASSDEKVFSAGGNLSAFGADAGPIEKFDGAERFPDCSAPSASSASPRSSRPRGRSWLARSAWRLPAT
jgi:enoyl-CoA hydratase/carnithine racemase